MSQELLIGNLVSAHPDHLAILVQGCWVVVLLLLLLLNHSHLLLQLLQLLEGHALHLEVLEVDTLQIEHVACVLGLRLLLLLDFRQVKALLETLILSIIVGVVVHEKVFI